jgi:hypothetical protein
MIRALVVTLFASLLAWIVLDWLMMSRRKR